MHWQRWNQVLDEFLDRRNQTLLKAILKKRPNKLLFKAQAARRSAVLKQLRFIQCNIGLWALSAVYR